MYVNTGHLKEIILNFKAMIYIIFISKLRKGYILIKLRMRNVGAGYYLQPALKPENKSFP